METMDYVFLAISILVLIALVTLIILVLTKKQKVTVEKDNTVDIALHEKIIVLQKEVEELTTKVKEQVKVTLLENNVNQSEKDAENNKRLTEAIQAKLLELNKGVTDALRGANTSQTELLTNLGKQLQALSDANKEVSKLGENVNQLTQVITGNNQKRGQFGEFMLQSILENIFETTPDMYSTQFDLNVKGEKVRPDAVLFLPRDKGNILPIDAKFPYANYLSIFDENGNEDETKVKLFKDDVKRKIDDISRKYIVDGVTTEYALCYFPSDEIYNYINARLHEIAEFARKKNVILVSPATLQPVLFTLRSLMIEYKRSEKLQELNELIRTLAKDFGTLRERWEKIARSVEGLSRNVSDFGTTFKRLDGKFERISDAAEIEEDK